MNINLNVLQEYDIEDFQNKKYTYNNNIYEIIKYNKTSLKNYETTDYDKFLNLAKYRSIITTEIVIAHNL